MLSSVCQSARRAGKCRSLKRTSIFNVPSPVEVGALPVYSETYDMAKIAAEIASDRERVKELWMRLEAVVHSRDKPGFSASVTAYLAEG
jgi:hypothetical protein